MNIKERYNIIVESLLALPTWAKIVIALESAIIFLISVAG